MRHSIIVERKGAWEAGWGRERVVLIKSLIRLIEKDVLEVRLSNRAENVSWYIFFDFRWCICQVAYMSNMQHCSAFWKVLVQISGVTPIFLILCYNCHLYLPSVNYINVLREAFTLVDCKIVKKIDNLTVIYMHLGSVRKNATRKMLMKLSPDLGQVKPCLCYFRFKVLIWTFLNFYLRVDHFIMTNRWYLDRL